MFHLQQLSYSDVNSKFQRNFIGLLVFGFRLSDRYVVVSEF